MSRVIRIPTSLAELWNSDRRQYNLLHDLGRSQGLFRHRARVPVAFVGSTKEWGKEAGRQEAKRLVVIEIQQVVYGKVN